MAIRSVSCFCRGHWFCQSCYMHPKHGPHLSVTWKPSNPFIWSVSEGSLESGGRILSVTLRSLHALVSHLCLTGLPEVAMPYSDMWHTRPCYAKLSYRSVDPQNLHGNVHQVDHVPNRPTDQLHRDNNSVPVATLWRQAIGRGHSRVTLRSEPTTH